MAIVPNIQVTYLAPVMAGLSHRGDVAGLSEQAGRAARGRPCLRWCCSFR